jgi:hypothetical protein
MEHGDIKDNWPDVLIEDTFPKQSFYAIKGLLNILEDDHGTNTICNNHVSLFDWKYEWETIYDDTNVILKNTYPVITTRGNNHGTNR